MLRVMQELQIGGTSSMLAGQAGVNPTGVGREGE
jgi:hypothetical protein